MRFYKKLYISPSLVNKRRRILWKLRTGRPQPTIFYIALAKNNDLFEICHSAMLKQRFFRKKENAPYIVGIANSYSAAIDLVSEMLLDVWNATESYNVKAYFNK